MRLQKITLLSVGMLVAVGLVLSACAPKASQKSEPTGTMAMPKSESSARTTEAPGAIEQTTCPIMGHPIDTKAFTEYNGQKVYFCCSDCIAKFNKDPERYLTAMKEMKAPRATHEGSGMNM